MMCSAWRDAVCGGSTHRAVLALGVTRQAVCSWIRGQHAPSRDLAARMLSDLAKAGVRLPAPEPDFGPSCRPGDEALLEAARQAAGPAAAPYIRLHRGKVVVSVRRVDWLGAQTLCRLHGSSCRTSEGAGEPGTMAHFYLAGGKSIQRRIGRKGLGALASEMRAALRGTSPVA